MARPKSATHDIKRDAILDIAAQCFAQRSYPAASMNEIATACGTSKARLYHYYESKEAILFDLLDRHTQRLLALIAQTEATAQRKNLDDRAALHELVRAFLQEYESSATRHAALLNDTQFLSDVPDPALGAADVSPRELVLNRQRDIVAAMTDRLAVLAKGFYTNNETGVDDCPASKPAGMPCACFLAMPGNLWNGYFGPYQV